MNIEEEIPRPDSLLKKYLVKVNNSAKYTAVEASPERAAERAWLIENEEGVHEVLVEDVETKTLYEYEFQIIHKLDFVGKREQMETVCQRLHKSEDPSDA